MGTRRRVAIWYVRRRGEFVVKPQGKGYGKAELVFPSQTEMLSFARSARLVLKQVGV